MEKEDKKLLLRTIPSLEKLISSDEFKNFKGIYPRRLVLKIARNCIENIRTKILNNSSTVSVDDYSIYSQVKEELQRWDRHGIKRVINATGVPLHTNMGRSPLCERAKKRLESILETYCSLEIDGETGKRGSRSKRVEKLLSEFTGAESAVVVNNDSSAVLLVLENLAKNKEVIISRGELVEIGGGFRIPEVMERSGCHLVEVGTTNKTRLIDYKKAITPNTGMLLKVHTSNFKIIGFTESVSLEELIHMAKSENLPLFYDQGNGLMINLMPYGFEHELNVIESIKAGVDIIAFSGDKLFGGPQGGIILGKKKYIEPLKNDPLMRALRPDKMTLACLEATIEEYLTTENPEETIPILNMLTEKPAKLKKRVEDFIQELINIKNPETEINLTEGFSEIGGGTFPGFSLPTFMAGIKSPEGANILQEKLRRQNPSIYCRISEDQVLIDLRTIKGNDRKDLLNGFKKVFTERQFNSID
ncbi:MAG TPA: L-seryl-tRNA(Sec) selenium transferase [Candidatus Eremiobacteraeota bacterium]|nr:MAG: L-seryl-tRNA(Sec) selenium transferase [bacterium ADurb.Bin363]HPZ10231.1 L-seryl-tRNA(Sec) selenium transferase [Candidatus Eremiobacteraeota bacterium]